MPLLFGWFGKWQMIGFLTNGFGDKWNGGTSGMWLLGIGVWIDRKLLLSYIISGVGTQEIV